jgi:ATP-dependent Clp protease ATP-binding subunit ClpB
VAAGEGGDRAHRELKEELEQLRLEIERRERAGRPAKASELQYGRSPSSSAARERSARARRAGRRARMLKEEVDEEDIAEVVVAWTGIPVSR